MKMNGLDEFNDPHINHKAIGYQIARRLAEAGAFNTDIVDELDYIPASQKEQHSVNRRYSLAPPNKDIEKHIRELLEIRRA
ncbi:MAG: hypothetical protein M3R15_10140 [Acidobacteriota bacterium]|nr:hypothetical protein [Acidobacteriota bacterium]